jgi:hypothetical protein
VSGLPFVTRPARQYTDEQVIESAVAAKLDRLLPASAIAAAQLEAVRIFDSRECALNTAIERAVANAMPVLCGVAA